MSSHARVASPRPVPILVALLLVTAGIGSGCSSPGRSIEPLPPVAVAPKRPLVEWVTERIRERLEESVPEARMVGSEGLRASDGLTELYGPRAYEPVWCTADGLRPEADSLLAAVRAAGDDGLEPDDYHLVALETALRTIRETTDHPLLPAHLADADLLLSDAFLLLATHLQSGRVNPETIDPEWTLVRPEDDPVPRLRAALESGDIRGALRALAPAHVGYVRLRDARMRFAEASRGMSWPALGASDTLKTGARDPRVPILRDRLVWLGDHPEGASDDPELYDATLQKAVRRFQRRHGLEPDGVIGPNTFVALDVAPEERVRQIDVNLERWRWLPRELGRRYVVVNIAAFELDVVEDDRTVLEMRIVAGREYRRTPVFSGMLRYLVFSPFWNIPPLLAREDVIPAVQHDSTYLATQGIRVVQGWGVEMQEIDPATVDWPNADPEEFPYRFRQDPGPLNALGGVKFMFPNKFDVYLHDTPQPDLFRKVQRDFSSGCIRVEKPVELAEYLLADEAEWSAEKILAAMAPGEERTVRLPRAVPIHLLYWTAWADEDGTLRFRRDVYGRDAPLYEALHRMPEGA